MAKIGWGVIGAGGIAHRRTLPVFGEARNSELRIVMDVKDPDKLGALYQVDWSDTVEAVLSREDVEAVYIAGPVFAHAEQVIAAANAGKHVLCEKPLACSVAEAKQAVEACIANKVLLREAYMLRHHAAHKQAQRLLQSGAIGKVCYAQIHWAFQYPKMEGAWRQLPALGGGGALADVGCHSFDMLELLVGPVTRLAGLAATLVQDYEVDDIATVLLEFENGAQGTITSSFCLSEAVLPTTISLYGERGSVVLRNTLTQTSDGELELYTEQDGQRRLIAYTVENTYVKQLEAFADDVATGIFSTEADASNLLRTMRFLEGAYSSAKTGQYVKL